MKKEKTNLRIVSAQLNATVGDIKGNTKKLIKNAIYARDKQNADIIIFPELFLSGYAPKDLLRQQNLYKQLKAAIKEIQKKVKNIYMFIGLPTKKKNQHYSSAIIIHNNKIIAQYNKQSLANAGIFDEKRYFEEGTKNTVIKIKGIKIGALICKDIWDKKILASTKKSGAQLIAVLNASNFTTQKEDARKKVIGDNAKKCKLPIIYTNLVGGQDDLIFDGNSMTIDSNGKIIQKATPFVEELIAIEVEKQNGKLSIQKQKTVKNKKIESIYKALVLSVKDYINKNKLNGVIIGSSGGIDSALTLAIAVDALGKNKVKSIYMPSRYSSKLSEKISSKLAKKLEIEHQEISIEPLFKQFIKTLPKNWPTKLENSTAENIQARCRATLLMAFANKENLVTFATGNKSEFSVGYATLYGDMAGAFAPLKDISKTIVYELAKYRNTISQVIPKETITRAPSAELAKNQKDSDDLPPYHILDQILERYIELEQPAKKIISAGFNKNTVTKIIKMVNKNEFKRHQAPPGPKITIKAFGNDRRYPITSNLNQIMLELI